MDGEQEEAFSKGEPRIHCLTLPRELKIRNGKLIQTPVKELEQLKGDEIPFIRDGDHTVRLLPGDRTWFLHFTLTEPEQKVSARFHSGESSLAWDPEGDYMDTESQKVYGGDELMQIGVTVPLVKEDFHAFVIHLERVETI